MYSQQSKIFFCHLFLLSTRTAEVKVVIAMFQHNELFAVVYFSTLCKQCFKDSSTAQNFKSACTKTTYIIIEAVSPHCRNELVMKIRNWPSTLSQMVQMTLVGYTTTYVIYIHNVLMKNNIPWKNCVGNGPVHVSGKILLEAKMLQENLKIYIHGCPCNIIHNTTRHAVERFLEVSKFLEEITSLHSYHDLWLTILAKGQHEAQRLLERFAIQLAVARQSWRKTELTLFFFHIVLEFCEFWQRVHENSTAHFCEGAEFWDVHHPHSEAI